MHTPLQASHKSTIAMYTLWEIWNERRGGQPPDTSNQILAPKYQFKCIMVFLWETLRKYF